jgi:hypothetical protein
MSGKIITAVAAAILLGSTVLASAQTREFPQDRYWGDYGYYGQGPVVYPPVTFGFGVAPYGYAYAPGYYDYVPGWRYNNGWNDNWTEWNRW